MDQLPLALSLHTFVDKYGAYAGFAAIVGLAVLVLIFFAQARETASLREHTAATGERIRQLEAQLAQLGRSLQAARAQMRPTATGATPAPPEALAPPGHERAPASEFAAPVPSPQPVSASPPLPGAPAGVGAPALAAATRMVAIASPPRPGAGGPGARREGSGAALAGPPAATAAGARNGVPPAAPVPAQPRREQPRRPLPPELSLLEASSRKGPRWRAVMIGALAAVVLAGIGAAAYALTSVGPGHSAAVERARDARRAAGRHAAPVIPAHVAVAVLNGTVTSHLALDTATRLRSAGFRILGTANAPSQSHVSTEVEYLARGDRADAIAVARALGLTARDVTPVVSADRQVACSGAAACPAQVIVVAGQDLQRLATTTATTMTG